ncbi:hypothetical protein RHSIM_Rhsim01G0147600 [Rhododendron simsii]|uniref:65-kDa microtubule-associated protein 3-like n=1 Tax=Rhododendron simsii TaxID=118357 RepID=A0A834HI81_RHOSS|nr:hypothetical protein RHSIM_Rhsim01G0147600 [Rhododendron simsii]
MEKTCGSLLSELQKIWDEVGEPECEKDKMLLELERECLEAYRRKVDQANECRARLQKAVADSEAEVAYICSAMGERPLPMRQNSGSLKEELEAIVPLLEDMRKRKIERRNQFVEVTDQIRNISKEICVSTEDSLCMVVLNESDLSLKRLEELHTHLLALQKEKSDRLKQVQDHLNSLNSLCVVLGMDFEETIKEIHPSLDDSKGTKKLSTKTMEKLSTGIQRLREVKIQRLQKLQDLATTMVELWSLMDTPVEEQLVFQNVTKNIAVPADEITEPNALTLDFINYAESEVSRLQQLKSSKIKEVILRKRLDLEELCRKAHMVAEAQGAVDYSVEAIESGIVDTLYVLEHIELQIANVKEEAFGRKDILDKVEKWLAACEEECWLEEYNRDDNRYNTGKGTHIVLKRAEKARAVVNKISAMVEALTSKATEWEKERGVEFSYDGVSLLSMLEKYTILKQEKELERQRQRDQKRLQGQLLAEQEVLFGSKPSPTKSGKKVSRISTGNTRSRRLSLGGVMLQTSIAEKTAPPAPSMLKKSNSVKHHSTQNHHKSGSSADPSSGKKTQEICGIQSKKHTYNGSKAHDTVRKPLSPVNSSFISKSNASNIQDPNTLQNEASQKTLPTYKTPVASPAKVIASIEEDEVKTPRTMPIPPPTTPPTTVSVAMHTVTTPATPCVPCYGEEVEYSFEERRAGFILPKSYLRSFLQL